MNNLKEDLEVVDFDDEFDTYEFDEGPVNSEEYPFNWVTEVFGEFRGYSEQTKSNLCNYLRSDLEAKKVLNEALDSLNNDERQFIKCYYEDGKSLSEIASERKEDKNTVFQLKESAMRILRNPLRSGPIKKILRVFEELNGIHYIDINGTTYMVGGYADELGQIGDSLDEALISCAKGEPYDAAISGLTGFGKTAITKRWAELTGIQLVIYGPAEYNLWKDQIIKRNGEDV